jgi:flagellar basal body rod protein FlgC
MTNPIGIAGSGIGAANAWLNAAADDIANAEDGTTASGRVHPAQVVHVAPVPSGGVAVTGVTAGGEVDLVSQVTEMIVAERAIQANAATIERSVDAFTALLSAGDESGIERTA